MSVGFRKSLFGFNRDDVLEYIENSQKSFLTKQDELSKQVSDLSEKLEISNKTCEKLNIEKDELSKKLADFNDKYEEIERLSENIGKLYLVAQANARAVIETTNESSLLAENEIAKNITAIDEAHLSLSGLKNSIISTSKDFVSEVDMLISSLNETKEQLNENVTKNAENKKQFEEVYKSITE